MTEIRLNCPFPHEKYGRIYYDRDKHLYYNTSKDVYYCHRCKAKGRGRYLRIVLQSKGTDLDTIRHVGIHSKPTDEAPPDPTATIQFPCALLPLHPGMPGYEYLLCDREIEERDIQRFGIGQGTGKYRDYVFLAERTPDGTLAYWVARRFRGGDAAGPKYIHAAGTPQDYLFGMYTLAARDEGRLWIVEGPISALAAPGAAVATLGCHVSAARFERLVSLTTGREAIYWVIEDDQPEEPLRRARELAHRLPPTARVYGIPVSASEDLADMLTSETLDYVEDLLCTHDLRP